MDYKLEIPDSAGVTEVRPGDQMPFLREQDYDERYRGLVSTLSPLQHRGLVDFLPLRPADKDDALNLLQFVAHAVSNAKMVEAAVPDKSMAAPTMIIPSGIVTPTEINLDWVGHLKVQPRLHTLGNPHSLANVHPQWSAVAWLRLGTIAKFVRKACLNDATPAALDEVSSRILLALATDSSSAVTAVQQQDVAFAWDLLDPHKLEPVLRDLNWNEVLKLRRQLLPTYANIRREIQKRVDRLLPNNAPPITNVRAALAELKREFIQLQEKELEALQSLEIKGYFTAASGVPLALSAAGIVIPLTWAAVATSLSGLAASNDLHKWFLAWRRRKKHIYNPIFALQG